jgi:two-component system sensor histidine kinase KdpD
VKSISEAVTVVRRHIRKTFDLSAAVFLSDSNGQLHAVGTADDTQLLSEVETQLVHDLHARNQAHLARQGALSMPGLLCIPLIVSERAEGVLAIRLENNGVLDPAQHELLDAFASHFAIVAEIQRLAHEDRRIQLIADSERLQKTLFDSVSHELKTPIAAIRVALEQPQQDFEEIKRANDRQHRAVESLLSATRIESGLIKLTREWCEPAEIATGAFALSRTEGKINLSIAEPLPLIFIDVDLTVQALATLLENAVTHGAGSVPPNLNVYHDGDSICFRISDHGRGLPSGSEEQIFKKFYRLPGTRAGGLGLGLSIARSLVETQGGSLAAVPAEHNGAVFVLRMPLGGQPQMPE